MKLHENKIVNNPEDYFLTKELYAAENKGF